MEEENVDDMSTGLVLTQFMDEWYYRIIHCGMANEMNKAEAAIKALDLFEACGMDFGDDEKTKLSQLDDEDFIASVVEKMPESVRKQFSHIALQVQLVMSAASRVRFVLDEGNPEEVARTMDDGDQGVNAQILKQTVLDGANEIQKAKEDHEEWLGSTDKRLKRMNKAQDDLEQAKRELDRANLVLETFPGEQNANSRKVLASMSAKDDALLQRTAFSGWAGVYQLYKNDRTLHDKYRKQLEEAERRLMEYKQQKVAGIRSVLQRNTEGAHRALLAECVRAWLKGVGDEKEDRAMSSQMEASKSKMEALKAGQKDNAKKSLMRMVQASGEALTNQIFQEWHKHAEYMKKNKDYEDMVAAQEAKVQEYMKAKGEKAKSVLQRMTSGSDTGVMSMAFKAWVDDYQHVKQAQELEDVMAANQQKFANLNARAKANNKNSASRANDLEEENTMMMIFMNWATEVKLSRLVDHFSGQIGQKKQQLEAVQSMFKSFATQLESGIATSPRTRTRTGRGHHSSRPPMPGHSSPASPP